MEEIPAFIFIVNPKSGTSQLQELESLLGRHFSTNEYLVVYTKKPGHASELCAYYKSRGARTIIAVGGDGTVNEIAKELINTSINLGIIPKGSGNGLARHLCIPMKTSRAVALLKEVTAKSIDTIKVNESIACNTSGLGFDATVSKHFGKNGKRGFANYVLLSFSLYQSSETFNLQINDSSYQNIWAMILANSDQMGNNAVVANKASVQDGIIDLILVRKPKWWQIPHIFYLVFTKKLDSSKLVTYLRGEAFEISSNKPIHHHIDGDYQGKIEKLSISIMRASLKVLFKD